MSQSNVYKYEDVFSYLKCPLTYRYKLWEAKERVVDARQAVILSARAAIRAFLAEGIKTGSSPDRCLDRAVQAYRNNLLVYDAQNIFNKAVNWVTLFNEGLIIIKRFYHLLNPRHDVPIGGPTSVSCQVGEDCIVGDLDGFIAFNAASRAEASFGIVVVGDKPAARMTVERFALGFAYSAFRSMTYGVPSSPLKIVHVNPHDVKVEISPITPEDKAVFESLSLAAINGMKNKVFVPQPHRAVCKTCQYDSSCKLTYCSPGDSPWKKAEWKEKEGAS